MSEEVSTAMPNPAFISDGQIALTARNNGDGTWDVTAGPGGEVLVSGVPREKAISIVGAPTGPYTPANALERKAADERVDAEQKLLDVAGDDVLKSDEENGEVPDHLKGFTNAAPRDPGAGAEKGSKNSPVSKSKNGGE